MAEACCCYTVNQGYLLPTLLSARQARAAIARDTADVIVFCIGARTQLTRIYEPAFRESGIEFRFVPPRMIDGLPIMFARFFLNRMLDRHYRAVLYLDGDTQVAGSLEPLIAADLGSGTFLAARDPMSIIFDYKTGKTSARYFNSIGIDSDRARLYCNSGVIRFNLADWECISREVLRLSAAKDHGFRFPDQDPLNIAFGKHYLTMSYKWNFPSFFMGLGFQHEIKPKVLHFMSNPRPWEGPFKPWGRANFDSYEQLLNRFPELRPFRQRLSRLRYIKYYLQQHYKHIFEIPHWQQPDVRRRIFEIEQESYI